MRFKDIISKYRLSLIVVVIAYLTYSFFVLSPTSYRSFSLIDDGQSIQNSEYFKNCIVQREDCSKLGSVLAERSFGRFRPGYWVIQSFLYNTIGIDAVWQHEFRVYATGMILVILLVIALAMARVDLSSILLSVALFVSSFTFSENMIRLGPVEPYQALFLGIFGILYLQRRFFLRGKKFKKPFLFALYLSLIFAVLVKETSFVAAFIPLILSRKKHEIVTFSGLLLVALTLVFLGRILARPQIGEIYYIENFRLDINSISSNAVNYLRSVNIMASPFTKIVFIITFFALTLKRLKKKLVDENLLFWLFVSILILGVQLPWRFVLERYLFVSIFFLSIVVGIVFSRTRDYLEENTPSFIKRRVNNFLVLNFLAILIYSNLFFRGFPINFAKTLNYKNWYETYLIFEKEQVDSIAGYADRELFVNATDSIDNWEVIYEIPIHLKYFHNREVKINRAEDDFSKEGILFTRVPFDLLIPEDKLDTLGFRLVDEKRYEIMQIDVIKFREKFSARPIQALLSPPLLVDTLKYRWEIRKIE